MIKEFGSRQAENIHIIPVELFVDTESGYPVNNAVHLSPAGYEQLAASFYSWIKWYLSTLPPPKKP